MTSHVPSFDIFRGVPNTVEVLWQESVEGLGAARQRMDVLAAEKPGPYFVFDAVNHTILATTDTSPLLKSHVESAKAAGAA